MHNRFLILIIVRATITIVLLFAAYYVLPSTGSDEGPDWAWLLLVMAAFGIIVAFQLPAIVKSRHPGARAVEALALLIPLYLLIFARVYLSQSLTDPGAFSEQLDHNTALYFTVTVFATVGFGDITAVSTPMRMMVTAQMLLNLVVLGAVIRLIATAAQRGMRRIGHDPTDPASRLLPPKDTGPKEAS